MTQVIAGMSMSLDGFVEDPSGSVSRLYPDFEALRGSESMKDTIAETGAVLMGRRAFDMGDPDSFVDTYEFQVPIFVLTHRPPATPPKQNDRLTFTFVSGDLTAAVEQAKAAAGDRDVTVVGGASLIQDLLRAGLVDELRLDVMPVLLGGGLRLLENLDPARVRLEKIAVQEIGVRTGLRFRVA